MNYQKIGSRGHIFTWEEPYLTNIYAINAQKHIFIIDTFIGPEPMHEVLESLESVGVEGKPFIVFNTHSDYDHYWGNQVFKGSLIISQDSAIKRIQTHGLKGLSDFSENMIGDVKITPPNLVFRKRLAFIDEGVEFFHSPGHTGDSSSCYDSVDNVLMTGDNLEAPYPYVNLLNLRDYTQSLEEYSKYDFKYILPSHDPLQYDRDLLGQNLNYIRDVATGHIDINTMDQRQLRAHYPNIVRMAELYTGKGDPSKAKQHYLEAINVLDLLEPCEENFERRKKIMINLEKISKSN